MPAQKTARERDRERWGALRAGGLTRPFDLKEEESMPLSLSVWKKRASGKSCSTANDREALVLVLSFVGPGG